MSTIDRYVARMFLSSYVILSAMLIAVYVLADLLVNIDEFTKDATLSGVQVLGLMADYYTHNLPLYFAQLAAPMICVAAAFTLGTMLNCNEMTALLAAGVPLQRIVAPIVVTSVVLLAAAFANREFVIPALADKIGRTHDDVTGLRSTGIYCARDERNAILSAKEFFPRQGVLKHVIIIEPEGAHDPSRVIEADRATWAPQRRVWLLERGRRVVHADPAAQEALSVPTRVEPVDEHPFGLPPEQLVLRRGTQWAELLSLTQLDDLLRSVNLPNRASIDLARHVRMIEPLAQLVMLLLAVPAFLSRMPTNVLVAGGRALVVSGAFFLVMFIAQGITVEDRYTALVAWIPILIFGPLAAVQLANVRT